MYEAQNLKWIQKFKELHIVSRQIYIFSNHALVLKRAALPISLEINSDFWKYE